MRYNDVRDGKNIVETVLQKYTAGWKERNMLTPEGLYVDCWRPKQDQMIPARDLGFTAW